MVKSYMDDIYMNSGKIHSQCAVAVQSTYSNFGNDCKYEKETRHIEYGIGDSNSPINMYCIQNKD